MGVRSGYQPGSPASVALPTAGVGSVRGGYKPSNPQPDVPEPTDIEKKVIKSFMSLPAAERQDSLARLATAAQKGDKGALRKLQLVYPVQKTNVPTDPNFTDNSLSGKAFRLSQGVAKTLIDPFVGGSAGEDNVQRDPTTGKVTSFDAGTALGLRDEAIKGVEARLMFAGGAGAAGAKGAELAADAGRGVKALNAAKTVLKAANSAGGYNAAATVVGDSTKDNIDNVAGTSFGKTIANIGKQAASSYATGAVLGGGAKVAGKVIKGAATKVADTVETARAPINNATIVNAYRAVADTTKPKAAPRAGSLADQVAEVAPAAPRPAHQAQIEAANAKGDMVEVKRIISAMPDTDPYKQSMYNLFKDRLPGGATEENLGNPQSGTDAAKMSPTGKPEGGNAGVHPDVQAAIDNYKASLAAKSPDDSSVAAANQLKDARTAIDQTDINLRGRNVVRDSSGKVVGYRSIDGKVYDTPAAQKAANDAVIAGNPGKTATLPEKPAAAGSAQATAEELKASADRVSGVKTPETPPTGGRVANDIPAPEKPGSKERKFITSVKDSPELAAGTKDIVEGTYDPISNKESIAKADARINASEGAARDYVLNARKPSAEHTATAIRLIDKFDAEGKHFEAAEIVEHIAKKLTDAGQAIQAASILGRLSPEGVAIYAQRKINKINEKRAASLLGRFSKDVELSPDTTANLRKLATQVKDYKTQIGELQKQLKEATAAGGQVEPGLKEKIQGAQDAQLEAEQELGGTLKALEPPSVLRKISTAQTIAQLLNPKTLGRNVIGNELFYRVERLNKYLATPVDIARSTLTGGDRQVTFRTAKQGQYWSNFLKGAEAGWKNVEPEGLGTQFDLGQGASFTGKFNPLTYLEKTLGATLRGFDFAAYKRAAGQTIGEMAELSAINKGLRGPARKAHIEQYLQDAPKNILDIADQYGKYITFQDSNVLSNGLSKVKKGLNFGKDFGLGDIVIKYPKTPGALVMRGLEYSPAGFLRSAYLLAKPFLSRKGAVGTDTTREATLALTRAITGSLGFTGLGYFLADKGVITGRASKDKDVNALEKQTGDGSYRINMTALRRWVFSGFNPSSLNKQENDYFASYDWAQPIAMAVSIGANANQSVKKTNTTNPVKAAVASIGDSIQTVADQPVLKGLTDFLSGQTGIVDSVTNSLKGTPASFVPTLSNQIRQLTDPSQRDAYTGSPLQQAVAQVLNKIPGQSEKLAPRVDTLGHALPSAQGTGVEKLFNVFLNPAITQRYSLTPSAKLVVDLYNKTGETTQVPRAAAKTVTIDGQKLNLSAMQYSTLQQFIGVRTDDAFQQLQNDDRFNSLSDDDKIQVMSTVMTKIGQDAKVKMFGGKSAADESPADKAAKSRASKDRSTVVKGALD